jgi:hypothetical protein
LDKTAEPYPDRLVRHADGATYNAAYDAALPAAYAAAAAALRLLWATDEAMKT